MAIWSFTSCLNLVSSGLVGCACEWACHVARSQFMWIVAPRLSFAATLISVSACILVGVSDRFCGGWNEGAWLWSFTFCRYLFSSGQVCVRASGLVMSRAVSICE